ncbi:MAG: hypothetical protein ACRD3O_24435 [Terriglobia bacterium]
MAEANLAAKNQMVILREAREVLRVKPGDEILVLVRNKPRHSVAPTYCNRAAARERREAFRKSGGKAAPVATEGCAVIA